MAFSDLTQSHLDRPDGNAGWPSPSLMGFPESIHHSAQRERIKNRSDATGLCHVLPLNWEQVKERMTQLGALGGSGRGRVSGFK